MCMDYSKLLMKQVCSLWGFGFFMRLRCSETPHETTNCHFYIWLCVWGDFTRHNTSIPAELQRCSYLRFYLWMEPVELFSSLYGINHKSWFSTREQINVFSKFKFKHKFKYWSRGISKSHYCFNWLSMVQLLQLPQLLKTSSVIIVFTGQEIIMELRRSKQSGLHSESESDSQWVNSCYC